MRKQSVHTHLTDSLNVVDDADMSRPAPHDVDFIFVPSGSTRGRMGGGGGGALVVVVVDAHRFVGTADDDKRCCDDEQAIAVVGDDNDKLAEAVVTIDVDDIFSLILMYLSD